MLFCIFNGLLLVYMKAQKKVCKGVHQTDSQGEKEGLGVCLTETCFYLYCSYIFFK